MTTPNKDIKKDQDTNNENNATKHKKGKKAGSPATCRLEYNKFFPNNRKDDPDAPAAAPSKMVSL